MKKMIKDVYGDEFSFDVEDKENVRLEKAGYIITPDGEYIPVPDDSYHSEVFSKYLASYLKQDVTYEMNQEISALTNANHVIYYGLSYSVRSRLYAGIDVGVVDTYIIVPENYKDVLTEPQKECIRNLILQKTKTVNVRIRATLYGDYIDLGEFLTSIAEKKTL